MESKEPYEGMPHQSLAIRLKPTALPQFDGNRRNFYPWKEEWEALQRQGEPTGSKEVKKIQLLGSFDDKVARDLRLSTYATADEIFRVLQNRFGSQTAIALEIIEDLQALPPVKGHHPRKIVDLIQIVEKALYDLSELKNTGCLKNPLVTKSLESKLPEGLKKESVLSSSGFAKVSSLHWETSGKCTTLCGLRTRRYTYIASCGETPKKRTSKNMPSPGST